MDVQRLTDMGNIQRVINSIGSKIRYSPGMGWFVWNGKRWERSDGLAKHKIAEVLEAISEEVAEAEAEEQDEKWIKRLRQWAQVSCMWNKVEAAERGARIHPDLQADPDEWDSNKFLLNCRNGVVNLLTGQLKQHDPVYMLTSMADVDYDAEALCPRWDQFNREIFNGDEEVIKSMLTFAGYSLTGRVDNRCMFVLYGDGANGKSVYLDTLHAILGDYAATLPTSSILTSHSGSIPNDIAALAGKRFVITSESGMSKKLDEARVKEVTGNATITARFLRKEFFTYQPQFKIWFATNHKPVITGGDDAIWERIKLIPFEVQFKTEDQDSNLMKNMLDEERSGILNWMIRGCLTWQGLGKKLYLAPRIKQGILDYKEEEDLIGAWMKERTCKMCMSHACAGKDMYADYKEWCRDSGFYSLNRKHFYQNLSRRGVMSKRISAGVAYTGIDLTANPYSITGRVEEQVPARSSEPSLP